MSPHPPAPASSSNATVELGAAIERSLSRVHELERTVSLFHESNQLLLLDRINGLVTGFAELLGAAEQCEAHVPLDVLRCVDEGRNPNEVTRELLRGCVAHNATTKGKVDAFKALRAQLLSEMDRVFPEETEAYRDLRLHSLQLVRQEREATKAAEEAAKAAVAAKAAEEAAKAAAAAKAAEEAAKAAEAEKTTEKTVADEAKEKAQKAGDVSADKECVMEVNGGGVKERGEGAEERGDVKKQNQGEAKGVCGESGVLIAAVATNPAAAAGADGAVGAMNADASAVKASGHAGPSLKTEDTLKADGGASNRIPGLGAVAAPAGAGTHNHARDSIPGASAPDAAAAAAGAFAAAAASAGAPAGAAAVGAADDAVAVPGAGAGDDGDDMEMVEWDDNDGTMDQCL